MLTKFLSEEQRLRRNALMRESVKKRRLSDPEAWRAKMRAYNLKYQAKHPERRKQSIRKYIAANREVCIQRTIASMRRRKKQCAKYRLRCYLSTRLWTGLRDARLRKKGSSFEHFNKIHLWFEWLKRKGYADWTLEGAEADHVIPLARFNLETLDGQRAANSWRNLFPLRKRSNRLKTDKIIPWYIRTVWRYADEYLNEHRHSKNVA